MARKDAASPKKTAEGPFWTRKKNKKTKKTRVDISISVGVWPENRKTHAHWHAARTMSQEPIRVTAPVSSEWLQKYDAEPISEFPDDILGICDNSNFNFDLLDNIESPEEPVPQPLETRNSFSIPAPSYSDMLDPALNPVYTTKKYASVARDTRGYASVLASHPCEPSPFRFIPPPPPPPTPVATPVPAPAPAPAPAPYTAVILRPRIQSFALSPPHSPPKPPAFIKRVMRPAPPSPPEQRALPARILAPIEEPPKKRPSPPPPTRRVDRATAAAAAAAAVLAAEAAAKAAAAAEEEEEEEEDEEEDEYYIDEEYEEEEEEPEPTKPALETYFEPGPFNGYNGTSTFFNTPTMAKGYYTNKFLFANNVDDIPGYGKFEHKHHDRTSRGYVISNYDGSFTRGDIYEFIFSPTDAGKSKGAFVYEKLGPARNKKKKVASGFFRVKLCHQEYFMAISVAPELEEWYRKKGSGYVFNPPASGS